MFFQHVQHGSFKKQRLFLFLCLFQILGEINNYDKCIDRVYNDKKIIKFFIQNNKVRGAFSINNGRDVKITKKLIINNFDIRTSQLENINFNLKTMI